MRASFHNYRELLLAYLSPQLTSVITLGVILFSNIILELVNPQIMRRFLDSALSGDTSQQLSFLAMTFLGIAFLQQLTAVGVAYLAENVSWAATNQMRYDLAKHCLSLDLSFHHQHTPGEMIERIDEDINSLSTFFSKLVLVLLGNGLLILGVFILLVLENWLLGGAQIIFISLTFFVLIKMRNLAVPYWKKERAASASYYSMIEETLTGTEEVRSSGAVNYMIHRFFFLLGDLWKKSIRAKLTGFFMVNVVTFAFALGKAFNFVVGSYLYFSGEISSGTIYLIIHYTVMLSRPINQISQQIENLQKSGAGFLRIQELFQKESHLKEKPASEENLVSSDQPLSFSFEKVYFSYHKEESQDFSWILKNLDFSLEAGKVLGVLGHTGSGKTTLTRLLLRFYDPNQGKVLLGDTNLKDLSLREVRQQIGMVTQNIQIFQGSIRDNLTFFDSSIPDEKITGVIYELGLQTWFESLEGGLDTILSSGGEGLSAGEAQLLAFTRVFLKNPRLIILDEASSRLDPATEQYIDHAIQRLLKGRTAIIIAHRLATVEKADQILILDQGEIMEYGDRQQLVENPQSQFSQLLKTGLQQVMV